ncbi:type IV pili glycosylation protein, partial [Francisella tularensis subsp. holarctica]|nr:type IV pili glycosylation protein [Francisella tularensis subsp. holarctica]
NKLINAPIKFRIPIMIAVFGLFIFVFYGLFVSPVLSKANQVQNHIQSMESQIPRLVKKEKDLAALKEQDKMLEQHNTEERFS